MGKNSSQEASDAQNVGDEQMLVEETALATVKRKQKHLQRDYNQKREFEAMQM